MLELFVLLVGALRALLSSRADLVAENPLLRHQLAVLTRPGRKRPLLRTRDKLLCALARRLCPDWRRDLVLARPETVVRWHRQAWKLLWRWRSRTRLGRPRLSAETRELIRVMSRDNPLWGTERIRGELLKPGIAVSSRSIRRYRWPGSSRPPSQTWRSFLANHRPRIWAADLFTVQAPTFKTLHVLLFIATTGAGPCTGTSRPARPPRGSGDRCSRLPRGAGDRGTSCGIGTPPMAATSVPGPEPWASSPCGTAEVRTGCTSSPRFGDEALRRQRFVD